VITNNITGKKKIVPVMCKSFAGSNSKIDPSFNPFTTNQQLGQQTLETAAVVEQIQSPPVVETVTTMTDVQTTAPALEKPVTLDESMIVD